MLFWPEISALGVFFNFDNERMRPPKYPSAPPGTLLEEDTSTVVDVVDGLEHNRRSYRSATSGLA